MNVRRFLTVMLMLYAAGGGMFWSADQACAQGDSPTTRPATMTAAPKTTWQEWKGDSSSKDVLGSTDPDSEYTFQIEFINDGAAINTVKLRDYFFSVTDMRLARSNRPGYEAKILEDPTNHPGAYSVLNPVWHDKDNRRLSLATRGVHIKFADGTELYKHLAKRAWLKEEVKTDGGGNQSIRYSWTLYRNDKYHPILKLTKTYTINKNNYSVDISLKAENLSPEALVITIDQAGPTGLPMEDPRSDMRKAAYGKVLLESADKVQTLFMGKTDDDFENLNPGKNFVLGSSAGQEPVVWVGQTNKFFGAMMHIVPAQAEQLWSPQWNAQFYVEAVSESPTSKVHVTGVKIPAWTLSAGKSSEIKFQLFVGPKLRAMFSDETDEHFQPVYKQLDYISTIEFRGCFCASDWLSMMMMRLLQAISKVTFGNYGVAIIVLVILVRLVLHPLTKKGQVSMAKMKKLGPALKQLEKKYANDKQALNRERVQIYKQQGATPVMGCLPMLLQMPILISLWGGINASIDLRHASFLPVWIIDLAAPDALFTWTTSLPVIGTSFNLLPLLLGGAMYWQMKLSPQANQVGATPEQQKQQKMMAVMMPLLMPLMFYSFASGLTLYFMASTLFGAIEQSFIRRHIEAEEATTAAMETTVQMPGKAQRGSRLKKPKGPTWVKRG